MYIVGTYPYICRLGMGIENASDHNRRIGRSQREQSAMQQGNDGCLGLGIGRLWGLTEAHASDRMIRLPPSRWYDPRTSTRGPRFTVQVQWGKSKSCWKDLIPNGGENWKNSPRSLNGLPVLLRGVGTLEKNFREIRCRYRYGAPPLKCL